MTNEGIYETLVAQLDKLARHNRQGSYRTKERYYEAFKRFCAFLADEYHLQKLANISGKHLAEYVLFMQRQGKAASTVKTDLAAIRFFHDKIESAKYRLPSNDELEVELERRRFGGVDRGWRAAEFERALGIAEATGRNDYILALHLGRFVGLRIHETFRIDTAIAEQAVREGAITIKGKGGKVRTVPIEDPHTMELLKKRLAVTKRGHKLMVQDDMKTDVAIAELQQFLARHRAEIQDTDDERPLTYHGLRHTRAAEKYRQLVAGGMSEEDARYEVSRLLGHERPDVTKIYLASEDDVENNCLLVYGGPDTSRQ